MKFVGICFSKVCRKDFHTVDTLHNLKANERQIHVHFRWCLHLISLLN